MSKMFHKVIVKEAKVKTTSRKRAAFFATIHTLIIALILFVVLQAILIGINVYKNFEAIKFAYEKPSIVNVIKKDYDIKQLKLEQSYVATQSAEEKIIDAVVAKLKATDLK